MKLLAIDTSTDIASVALLVDNEMTSAEQASIKTHAQFVLPLIDSLLSKACVPLNQLDAIVFGRGPGSFTGLRIACSIAKGLAFAHDLGLIPVSSLETIAYSVRAQENNAQEPVLAVLDARMHEVYWSYFAPGCLVSEERVSAVQDIQVPKTKSLILAGLGIDTYWDDVPDDLKAQVGSRLSCYPTAVDMIKLTVLKGLKPVSAADAQPIYVRNQVTQGDSRG